MGRLASVDLDRHTPCAARVPLQASPLCSTPWQTQPSFRFPQHRLLAMPCLHVDKGLALCPLPASTSTTAAGTAASSEDALAFGAVLGQLLCGRQAGVHPRPAAVQMAPLLVGLLGGQPLLDRHLQLLGGAPPGEVVAAAELALACMDPVPSWRWVPPRLDCRCWEIYCRCSLMQQTDAHYCASPGKVALCKAGSTQVRLSSARLGSGKGSHHQLHERQPAKLHRYGASLMAPAHQSHARHALQSSQPALPCPFRTCTVLVPPSLLPFRSTKCPLPASSQAMLWVGFWRTRRLCTCS